MLDRRGRHESQGHDKVLTLTHCRFEVKASFGIENVLVVDFDEFLYCPAAEGGVDSTIREQTIFLHHFIDDLASRGIQQIVFPQRQTLNLTASPRDCMLQKVKKNRSLFECFASYNQSLGGHSVKSLHVGHVCPLTGYHEACPHPELPRTYNCMCDSHRIMSKGGGAKKKFLKQKI